MHAVAGIGNPQRFFDLLDEAGLDVMPHPLEDHAEIGPDQLTFDEPGAVLITEKDAVKCESIAPRERLVCRRRSLFRRGQDRAPDAPRAARARGSRQRERDGFIAVIPARYALDALAGQAADRHRRASR